MNARLLEITDIFNQSIKSDSCVRLCPTAPSSHSTPTVLHVTLSRLFHSLTTRLRKSTEGIIMARAGVTVSAVAVLALCSGVFAAEEGACVRMDILSCPLLPTLPVQFYPTGRYMDVGCLYSITAADGCLMSSAVFQRNSAFTALDIGQYSQKFAASQCAARVRLCGL